MGAVGAKAITPKYIEKTISKDKSILDFGAGKDAAHAEQLKKKGYDVTAYEFGDNINPELHDINALSKKYDVVYASNVINTQGSERMLNATLEQISSSMDEGGKVILNFPLSPRKGAWLFQKGSSLEQKKLDIDNLEQVLGKYFKNIKRIGGGKYDPLYELSR